MAFFGQTRTFYPGSPKRGSSFRTWVSTGACVHTDAVLQLIIINHQHVPTAVTPSLCILSRAGRIPGISMSFPLTDTSLTMCSLCFSLVFSAELFFLLPPCNILFLIVISIVILFLLLCYYFIYYCLLFHHFTSFWICHFLNDQKTRKTEKFSSFLLFHTRNYEHEGLWELKQFHLERILSTKNFFQIISEKTRFYLHTNEFLSDFFKV